MIGAKLGGKGGKLAVLILILMEYTFDLWAQDEEKHIAEMVLILILMEYTFDSKSFVREYDCQ